MVPPITPQKDSRLAIEHAEQALRQQPNNDTLLDEFQRLCRHYENSLTKPQQTSRHHFVIVIPVADRPRQLKNCLDSLLEVCKLYGYGGFHDGVFYKVSVIIADDSKDGHAMQQHQALAKTFSQQGLSTDYFGLEQQLQLLDNCGIDAANIENPALKRILGEQSPGAFYHKGPSRMRNLCYLKLQQLAGQLDNPLFYFIDSDQEFNVLVNGHKVFLLNYFYHLDRLFSENDIRILTGKVVGDPPVSPAVMTSRFLDDVQAFLDTISATDPESGCGFHKHDQTVDDIAYHDMADLFGFQTTHDSYQYPCPLQGPHSNSDCLDDFSQKLGHFFHGEHPTRKTGFDPAINADVLVASRTVYTGNYVATPEALEWFIPFADLRLRMAGPVLGRLVQAGYQQQFVSANLPMLHNRTLDDTGTSEFRPGVLASADRIDLSGEFERQFFGDVMLFTVKTLVDENYLGKPPSVEKIQTILRQTCDEMLVIYREKQTGILDKLKKLDSTLTLFAMNNPATNTTSIDNIRHFIDNIHDNFHSGSMASKTIYSASHQNKRLQQMTEALHDWHADRQVWSTLLSRI